MLNGYTMTHYIQLKQDDSGEARAGVVEIDL